MKPAALALAFGLAGCGAAWAQIEVRPAPSEASQCLVATDAAKPAPLYPFEAYREGLPGRVLVQLRFSAPDQPPASNVLEQSGGSAFAQAVREWARTLRAPCHNRGEAVVLQEYLFEPHRERVSFGPPRDEAGQRLAELARCAVHTGRSQSPRFPSHALQSGVQGRVLAQMRFLAPDQPPEVQLFHRRTAKPLADAVSSWVQGYRMPCFEPGRDEAAFTTAEFIFRIEDDQYGFMPLSLVQFMGRVKGIRQQTLEVDTTTMGCPFDVQLQYLQPLRRNIVGVRGEYRAEREPLLQWLRQAELDLPAASLDSIYADHADIAVPCVRIALKPQEKTP